MIVNGLNAIICGLWITHWSFSRLGGHSQKPLLRMQTPAPKQPSTNRAMQISIIGRSPLKHNYFQAVPPHCAAMASAVPG